MSSDKTIKICLWSGPRNISTTLMYSFAQRKDTKVFDEPLYGYYLKQTGAKKYHPDASEIMSSMDCNGERVIATMMGKHKSKVVFFKNMTHHLLDLDRTFMQDGIQLILTRNPKEMLPSFDKVIHNPKMIDVGYAAHTELINYFEANNISYFIIDSKKILLNPERVLELLCDRLGIPFDKNMLNWKSGARPEDGIWAKHWYNSIHKSTGFKPYEPKSTPFPKHLEPLLIKCMPHYEALLKKAIG